MKKAILVNIILFMIILSLVSMSNAENIDSLTVDENGNVGIGTQNSNGKLQVQGKIRLGSDGQLWEQENSELGIYSQSKGANTDAPDSILPAVFMVQILMLAGEDRH